ncbi:MAG TPA: ABC transporter permease [Terriglobia bacterium]|nr:ABC transporter permease [Terriglobia bacterium]
MGWRKGLFRKRPLDQQLDSELRFHIDELTEANIALGFSPEEARRRAVLEFGGQQQIREEVQDVYRLPLVESALANLKSALRFMRKSPAFSITVVATLALGIGANSAVFSALDAVILRPLPFPDADQLVRLDQINPKVRSPETQVAPVRLEDWNRMNSTFQAIAGYYTQDESETSGTFPEKVTMAAVTPRFLQVWGVAPALGRGFNPDEERFGGPDAVIISDRYWRGHFGANPDALGKKLHMGGYSYTIVGIMPASFLFPERDVDAWSAVPMNAPYAQSRDSAWFITVGRLKPCVTVQQAQANLTTVQAQLGEQYPKTDGELAVYVQPLKDTIVGDVRGSLWFLFGSVSLLLVIGCTNVAALLLARATQRQHEIAIRFSLGASRTAVVIQLLAEAFVLALTGAAFGLAVAGGASRAFRALAGNLPRIEEIRLDWRIVLYSLVCTVVVTLLCGLLPALRATRRNLSGSMAQANRTQVSTRSRLQWLLVGVQVSLAVALLAGAGLLLRSFQALGKVSPGFEAGHILTLHISGGWGETADMRALAQRIDRTLDALGTVPGVEATATSANPPGVPAEYETEHTFIEGQTEPGRKVHVESRFVSASYFFTMQIPLLAGELCREPTPPSDPKGGGWGSLNVMVNRSFANTYLPGATPIGYHVQLPGGNFIPPPGEIRGVVGDAREQGLNHAPVPTVYWCVNDPDPDPYYLIRTQAEPMTMAQTLRRKIHEIEPARSVFDIMPLDERLGEAFVDTRLRTVLLSFFAVTAVSLACLGLYGTLSYFVNVRRREVGLRLALGAARGQVLRQFLLEGLGVAVLGCVCGLALAVAFTRVLAGMLSGVSPSDATTLVGVVLLILTVAAGASLLPAARAARVDPMQVLREE